MGTHETVSEKVIRDNVLDIDGLDVITHLLVNKSDLQGFYVSNPDVMSRLNELTENCLKAAFIVGDRTAQREVQQTLFNLYQTYLSEPLSCASSNQYDPALIQVRSRLENNWLEYEKRRYGKINVNLKADNVIQQLRDLWISHRASHHPLFDFLATKATEQQIYYFFKSDSALNLLFFDLVAMTLVGSFPETRGEISHNLWDEIGEGSNEFTHVNLYKDLLDRRGIELPEDHFSHLYDWQGLAGYNAFMLGGVTRKHYYKFIGVMAMTEILDPSQYEKLVTGCRRIGLSDRDVHYYSEHITVDIGHADGWLKNVIEPISKKNPDAMSEIYFGAVLRLQTCGDYYDHLYEKMKSI
ncbi:TPA: iron-containing redox enzyme family protein [Klebsiella variicola subsp. variicola]